MISKIISGGQTGADIAGVKFGKAHGYDTGGWMPSGYRTENGYRSEYRLAYNMLQTHSSQYPARTKMNVISSDGTLIFGEIKSKGSWLTKQNCINHDKPYFHCRMDYNENDILHFKRWLYKNNIETLNVAGNRESTNPGIEIACYSFLEKTIGNRNVI
jgi:hypothetical protein